MPTTPIYSLRVLEVHQALETSPLGIANAEAESRLLLYGPNILSKQKKTPVWEKLFLEVIHPPALVLIGVGMVALLLKDFWLAVIIWSIILINTGFSFWREYRAEQAIE